MRDVRRVIVLSRVSFVNLFEGEEMLLCKRAMKGKNVLRGLCTVFWRGRK